MTTEDSKGGHTAATLDAASAGEVMAQAISDASCANNAVRQVLDAMQEVVYSELGTVERGLYEAAIASTERVDRALSRGLEAGEIYSPALPGGRP